MQRLPFHWSSREMSIKEGSQFSQMSHHLILLGSENVGKTTIAHTLVAKNPHLPSSSKTRKGSRRTNTYFVRKGDALFKITDTPGEPSGERLNSEESSALDTEFSDERSLLLKDPAKLKSINPGFIVIFELSKLSSLERALFLLAKVRARDRELFSEEGYYTPIVLIGNKADLVSLENESNSLLEMARSRIRKFNFRDRFVVFTGNARMNEYMFHRDFLPIKQNFDLEFPTPSSIEDILNYFYWISLRDQFGDKQKDFEKKGLQTKTEYLGEGDYEEKTCANCWGCCRRRRH